MKKVAVIFGGQSTEHDISIITALAAVIRPLKTGKTYDVVPIYIAKNGKWYSEDALMDVKTYQSGKIDEILSKTKPVLLDLGEGMTLVKGGLRPVKTKIDVVFPAMHGTNGEDGALMGLLQMAGVPYVGCDMRSSAIAMDKALSKAVAAQAGVDIANAVHVLKKDYQSSSSSILETAKALTLPLYVKPTHLGSSIGISRVTSYDELENALEVALHYDYAALVEEAVPNLIEVTVPVMGNDEPKAGLVEKPLTQADDFFDFSTKYMSQGDGKKSGGTKTSGSQGYSQLPAELPDGLYERAENVALSVYRALGCSGIARIDLLIDSQKKTVYFNEVNPLPGSLYAHNWRQSGVSTVQLVEDLIDLAVDKFEKRAALEHSFSSNFLGQF